PQAEHDVRKGQLYHRDAQPRRGKSQHQRRSDPPVIEGTIGSQRLTACGRYSGVWMSVHRCSASALSLVEVLGSHGYGMPSYHIWLITLACDDYGSPATNAGGGGPIWTAHPSRIPILLVIGLVTLMGNSLHLGA